MIIKAVGRLTRERRGSEGVMWTMHIRKSLDVAITKEGTMPSFKPARSAPRSLTFELVARPLLMSSEESSLLCPACGDALDLHQPDENRPTHLVGICEFCSKWFFLVEIDADWNGALI